jgi:hypothetical protein
MEHEEKELLCFVFTALFMVKSLVLSLCYPCMRRGLRTEISSTSTELYEHSEEKDSVKFLDSHCSQGIEQLIEYY